MTSPSVSTFLRSLESVADSSAEQTGCYLAFVASVAADIAMIWRPEETILDAFEADVPYGFNLSANDVVLAVNLGRRPVVIMIVRKPVVNAFSLDNLLNVTSGGVHIWSGSDLRGYSDLGVTEKFRIDSATGDATFNNILGTSFNSPIPIAQSQNGADTATNNLTGTYAQALTFNLALPIGTWSFDGVGGCDLSHGASGTVNLELEVDGSADTARTVAVLSTEYMQIVDDISVSGVSGNRTIAIRVLYKPSTAGTVTAKNPWIWMLARRTA